MKNMLILVAAFVLVPTLAFAGNTGTGTSTNTNTNTNANASTSTRTSTGNGGGTIGNPALNGGPPVGGGGNADALKNGQ